MKGSVWNCGVVIVVVLAGVLSCSASVSDKLESDFFDNPEVTLHLSHSLNHLDDNSPPNFVPRGSVTVRNFRGPRWTSNQKDLTLNELEMLKRLALADDYYFVVATIKSGSSGGEQSFRGFVHAKSLLDSGLSDIIRVHVSPSGDIVSVNYALARNDFYLVPHHLGSNRPPPQKFNTTVLIHYGEYGPVPDTAPYLEKLEHERLAKERGEDPRDNRSFFAKYWMYIVPIALLVLLSGASNPEEGGGAAR